MSEKEQTDLATITCVTSNRCPACGAGDFGQRIEDAEITAHRCGHCGFRTQPCDTGTGHLNAPPARLIDDLGLTPSSSRILALLGPNDGAPLPGITFIDAARIAACAPALAPFDAILAGQALDSAADVNQLMTCLSHLLRPRGLLVADTEQSGDTRRFGGRSLQILLERHGFRLAGRPLKWRLSLFGAKRRILARRI